MHKIAHSRALILSRPAVIAVLSIAFVLILGTGLLTAFSTRGLALADQRSVRAQHTLAAAMQLLTTSSDAPGAARSAILTGEEKYFAAYRADRGRYRAEMADLRREFAHRDGVASVFVELQQLSDARFVEFDRALAVLGEQGPLPALSIIGRAESEHPADELRRLVAVLQRQEFGELAEQCAVGTQRAGTIRLLNVGLILLAGGLAVAVAFWLISRSREFDKMITVCAWTRRVHWHGRWISFEEYLVKRFDLRCTHGICAEAAETMKAEAAKITVPAELRRTKTKEPARLNGVASSTPFA